MDPMGLFVCRKEDTVKQRCWSPKKEIDVFPFRCFFHSCFFNKKLVIRKSQDNTNQPCFLFQWFLGAVLCFVHVYLSIIYSYIHYTLYIYTLDSRHPNTCLWQGILFTRKKNTFSHLLQKVWLDVSVNPPMAVPGWDPWGPGGALSCFTPPHVKEPFKRVSGWWNFNDF